MKNNMHKGYMARPKPLAQGELLTHRDEINNHKHCNENHKIDSNSITMSPIKEEIYYYKWWNMAMVVEKGLEIRSKSIPPTALQYCGCRFLRFCGGLWALFLVA